MDGREVNLVHSSLLPLGGLGSYYINISVFISLKYPKFKM